MRTHTIHLPCCLAVKIDRKRLIKDTGQYISVTVKKWMMNEGYRYVGMEGVSVAMTHSACNSTQLYDAISSLQKVNQNIIITAAAHMMIWRT